LARIDVHLAQQCDAVIANSSFTADMMEQTYGFPAAGIAMPGLSISAFTDRQEPRSLEIIAVARLTKFKRVDFLLEVFAELLNFYPEMRFNIVGTGEEKTALQNMARRLGIQSHVLFHGAPNDKELAALYQRSLLFLHGAQNEPFGMAPLEAIASGTPVVAHQSGGVQEFINDRCGRLIDSSDPVVWGKLCTEYISMILSRPDVHTDIRACAQYFEWGVTLKPALEIISGIAQPIKPATGN
jgi:glycosyltransferase involved in cell wall biosynthesis